MTIQVYERTTTGMNMSRDGELFIITCSDGTTKLFDSDFNELFGQKRNNLPVTCSTFITLDSQRNNIDGAPDYFVSGSADLKYNLIEVERPGFGSMLSGCMTSLLMIIWKLLIVLVLALYAMDYC